jgi:hypothetical protein
VAGINWFVGASIVNAIKEAIEMASVVNDYIEAQNEMIQIKIGIIRGRNKSAIMEIDKRWSQLDSTIQLVETKMA